MGVMCCYQVLIFTIGSQNSKPAVLSLTLAFLNCINMLGGAFFHGIIGLSMDFFSNRLVKDGLYSVDVYQKALLVIPFCSVLGSILTIAIRKLNK